jgi:hypothetical protein
MVLNGAAYTEGNPYSSNAQNTIISIGDSVIPVIYAGEPIGTSLALINKADVCVRKRQQHSTDELQSI